MAIRALILSTNLLYGVLVGVAWHKATHVSGLIEQFYSNPITLKLVVQKQSSKPTIIYNDKFVGRALENDLIYKKIVKAYNPRNINKKIVQNAYEKSSKDTIVNFESNGDAFTFYKGTTKILLQQMNLVSKTIILDKNISIGCDKNLFKNKYKSSSNSDVFVIQDPEGGNVFTFTFKDNKLIRVSYKIEYME